MNRHRRIYTIKTENKTYLQEAIANVVSSGRFVVIESNERYIKLAEKKQASHVVVQKKQLIKLTNSEERLSDNELISIIL